MNNHNTTRYFLKLAYRGTAYNGWQNQSSGKGISIQSKLEEAISILCRQPTSITGCGRTDTGVHATEYYAHFNGPHTLDKVEWIMKLNKMLPRDIALYDIIPVHPTAHARYDAISRSYQYHLHTHKDPFLPCSLYYTYGELNLELLNHCASMLLEFDDFATFCKTHTDVKTTLCKISDSRWEQISKHQWVYHITADRFLRGMVRLVVGMCLNIQRGKLSLKEAREAIATGSRTGQDWSVPPDGLFLSKIQYPYLAK